MVVFHPPQAAGGCGHCGMFDQSPGYLAEHPEHAFQMENPLSVEELQEMGITAMNTPAIKDYGKTWVAYRRRPEEVTS